MSTTTNSISEKLLATITELRDAGHTPSEIASDLYLQSTTLLNDLYGPVEAAKQISYALTNLLQSAPSLEMQRWCPSGKVS